MCLPCLRCGLWSVPVGLIFGVRRRETLACVRCAGEHYLEIQPRSNGYDVCYQRYTLRYPLECYDEGLEMPVVTVGVLDSGRAPVTPDGFAGPILIYPRRRRYTPTEIRAIWQATNGRCHLCQKRRWKLSERGRSGWHVDHVIPHAGGGPETETIANLRVACWRCNLQKGRGYSEADVRWGLQRLISELHRCRPRDRGQFNASAEPIRSDSGSVRRRRRS